MGQGQMTFWRAVAGSLGGVKKALFLLYIEANSISLGADSTQYNMPGTRCAPEARK